MPRSRSWVLMSFHGASAAVYWHSHELLFLNTEYRFHARWTSKSKSNSFPRWECQWKMKWIEFFHAQSQRAVTWSSTPAPHVSKQGRNTPRPRARCTLSFHSHALTDVHIGSGTPSLWYAPISPFPAKASETLAKWPTLCKHLGGRPTQRAIWHGLQDLPFLCTNYSGHSDKSRGRWRSTCVWNSLNFITNHQGLSQGQALWLLQSHALISGW